MSLLELAKQGLARQYKHTRLNAYVNSTSPEAVLAAATAAQDRRDNGRPLSPIDGRMIAIKDNICTSTLPTTCGSAILQDFKSPFDATVVSLLQKAGAVIAGKTNLDEFGMGSHSTHSHFGVVKNGIKDGEGAEGFSAGGSSGGSAVAVQTEQCHVGLGTDTGGSVRLPAAYTGIVGFKPSYGLLSRWGVVAYANSLDTVGIMSKTTADTREVFNILNQHDPQDPTSLSTTTRSRILSQISSLERSKSLRIGVPAEYNIQELSPEIRQSWESTLKRLSSQGHTIHHVSLPATKHALSAYYVLAPAEASSNLAKFDGVRYGTRYSPSSESESDSDASGGYLYANTRGHGFGEEVKRRILLGAFSLSAEAFDNYFIQAQKVRRLVQQDFDRVFAMANPLLDHTSSSSQSPSASEGPVVDVLICPTAPSLPPKISDVVNDPDPLDAYANDVFTVPASLAGLPAVSVPVKAAGADTVGMQVIGQFGDDDLVLDVGRIVMEA